MPYEPSRPGIFRDILNKLAAERSLSSQKAVNLLDSYRSKQTRAEKGDAESKEFSLTVQSLARFKRGAMIGSHAGLRVLWKILERHADYKDVFPQADNKENQVSAEDTLIHGMTRFFVEDIRDPPVVNIYDAEIADIAGSYALTRTCWQIPNRPDLATVSLVQIWRNEHGFAISEEQHHPPETEGAEPFRQRDSGAIVAFGRYLYFLMRENNKGSTVKFGRADDVLRDTDGRVKWFGGVLYYTSTARLYPTTKFFCRKISKVSRLKQGIFPIKDLPDPVAKAYLLGVPEDDRDKVD